MIERVKYSFRLFDNISNGSILESIFGNDTILPKPLAIGEFKNTVSDLILCSNNQAAANVVF